MNYWMPIKGFSKYEINSDGVIRNAATKKTISQRLGSKYTYTCILFDDFGKKRNVKVKVLMEASFPQKEVERDEWVPIKDFEKYLISRNGKIKNSETGRVFNPQKTSSKGYYTVTLKGKDNKYHFFLIHRLVAQTFIPNPDNLPIVNHIDENKKNNHVSNLEWVSPTENARHATSPHRISIRKLRPVNEYDENGKYLRTWKSYKHIKLVYKACIGTNIRDGYYCGHLFRPYENSTNDLHTKEIPNYKPKRKFDKEGILIPQEYLYSFTEEMPVSEIFKKYKPSGIGNIPSSDRKKDFEIVFKRIEELEIELSKQK